MLQLLSLGKYFPSAKLYSEGVVCGSFFFFFYNRRWFCFVDELEFLNFPLVFSYCVIVLFFFLEWGFYVIIICIIINLYFFQVNLVCLSITWDIKCPLSIKLFTMAILYLCELSQHRHVFELIIFLYVIHFYVLKIWHYIITNEDVTLEKKTSSLKTIKLSMHTGWHKRINAKTLW